MATKINIEIDEDQLKKLIINHLKYVLGEATVELKDITIEVKSKQNYKAEWESASFRARISRIDLF